MKDRIEQYKNLTEAAYNVMMRPMRRGVEAEFEDPFGGLGGIPDHERPTAYDPYSDPNVQYVNHLFDNLPDDTMHDILMGPGEYMPYYHDPFADHDGDGIPNVYDPDNKYYHPDAPGVNEPDPEMDDPFDMPFPAVPRPDIGELQPIDQDPGFNPWHKFPYIIPGGVIPYNPFVSPENHPYEIPYQKEKEEGEVMPKMAPRAGRMRLNPRYRR